MSHLESLPEVCRILLRIKAEKGLSFETIASRLDRDEVWVAALFYGQAKPTVKDLEKLAAVMMMPPEALVSPVGGLGETFFPTRGGPWESIPKDPLLYRLYEILIVYGFPIKHIIHEKFGDGIMSAIDFNAHVEKIPNPAGGERVKITLDGKFLPYSKW